jgi:uncharacterized protein (DUF885 family)
MKTFHDAVLNTGTVPLDLLARQVQSILKF